jgi:hypothetical protein
VSAFDVTGVKTFKKKYQYTGRKGIGHFSVKIENNKFGYCTYCHGLGATYYFQK